MAIYKGTSPIALNGANGADGQDGQNGIGAIAVWQNTEVHNESEGSNSSYDQGNNSVSGASYSLIGGYQSTQNGGNSNLVFGRQNECNASEGNSVYGYGNKLTHASQGCHVEGYSNWFKGSQGGHMEGFENAAEGGQGIHIEGYGHGDFWGQTLLQTGSKQGCHIEGFRHQGLPLTVAGFGAHICGKGITQSSTLNTGNTSGFFKTDSMELFGGETTTTGSNGGLIRQMDGYGNMAIGGNFGCWIKDENSQDKFITVQDLYDMIQAINPPL